MSNNNDSQPPPPAPPPPPPSDPVTPTPAGTSPNPNRSASPVSDSKRSPAPILRKELPPRRTSNNQNINASLLSSTSTTASRPPRPGLERQGSQTNRERLPSYDRVVAPTMMGMRGQGSGHWPSPQQILRSNPNYPPQPLVELPPQLQQPSLQGSSAAMSHAQADATLLMASLDRVAVEDEAEAALINVLERRQVTFADPNILGTTSSHRRHRTFGGGPLPAAGVADLLAGQSPEGSLLSSRPNLINRGTSLNNSKRNLLDTPPSLVNRNSTAPGEISASLNAEHRDSEMSGTDGESGDETPALLGMQHPSQTLPSTSPGRLLPKRSLLGTKNASFTNWNRRIRHSRHTSAIPSIADVSHSTNSSLSGLTTGISSTALSSLSTPGERALHVAMALKTANPNSELAATNVEESTSFMEEGALPDLVNLVEAKRERDEETFSQGSNHDGVSRGSRGSGSRKSAKRASVGSREGSVAGENSTVSGSRGRGRKHKPFAGITSPWSRDEGPLSNIDHLFQNLEQVEDLFNIPEGEESEEDANEFMPSSQSVRSQASVQSNDYAAQDATWLSQLANSHPEIPPTSPASDYEGDQGFEVVRADENTPMLEKAKLQRTMKKKSWSVQDSIKKDGRIGKIIQGFYAFRMQMKLLVEAFDVPFVKQTLFAFFQNQVSLFIVPALAVSAFFFYRLGNPSFEFLPTDASVSWWILFVIRQYMTLQLAYATEYMFVEVFSLQTPYSVKVIGPLATLYTINSKGWPFIMTVWGIWDFILLQGSGQFFDNWLFFTDIEMFTSENRNAGVMSSDLNKRILTSMIIAGVATSIKRTIIALYLGKRVYMHYKPKLEKVMVDMLLLSEVAEIASALDEVEFEKIDGPDAPGVPRAARESSAAQAVMHATITDLVQSSKSMGQEDDLDSYEENLDKTERTGNSLDKDWTGLRSSSNASDDEPIAVSPSKATEDPERMEDNQENVTSTTQQFAAPPDHVELGSDLLPKLDNFEPAVPSVHEPVQSMLRQDSTNVQIKPFLDRWEEPKNKLDKEEDPTIHKILQFRKALSLLDDEYPFSRYFGAANTRDACLKSSKFLYKRLLGFAPGSTVLPFDVIQVLAYDAEGNFDEKKAKGLIRLFRPDKYEEVTMLAFVQTCDGVYKRLRYLRASVGNSTLIDYVLENIFNSLFYFVLVLTILSILHLNPWALLVSMSTILVSISFALGPSAAKLIEGMMMIAIRRPFDLGDRISVVGVNETPGVADPGFSATYFVEDCNLFTTTLRLSRSNETCTVNNGAISNFRIVNHGRSANAMVSINLPMRFPFSQEEFDIVRSTLEQYIRDNPRVWVCLVNFRIVSIDPANESSVCQAVVQNVKSWQELLPVLTAKGELLKFCQEVLVKLNLHGTNYPKPMDLYVKGVPDEMIMPPGTIHGSLHGLPQNGSANEASQGD